MVWRKGFICLYRTGQDNLERILEGREPSITVLLLFTFWGSHEGERTDAEHRGGPIRRGVKVFIMEMERRDWIIWPCLLVNQEWEESKGEATLPETAAG